jgi:hypothetical protein
MQSRLEIELSQVYTHTNVLLVLTHKNAMLKHSAVVVLSALDQIPVMWCLSDTATPAVIENSTC